VNNETVSEVLNFVSVSHVNAAAVDPTLHKDGLMVRELECSTHASHTGRTGRWQVPTGRWVEHVPCGGRAIFQAVRL